MDEAVADVAAVQAAGPPSESWKESVASCNLDDFPTIDRKQEVRVIVDEMVDKVSVEDVAKKEGEGEGEQETQEREVEVAIEETSKPAAAPTATVEETPCCRVCHGESEPGHELYYPCKCDGSIKYIHQDCLIEWIKHSKQSNPRCELCGEPFRFRNIYKEGAPLRLTILELIKELLPRFFDIIWWIVNVVIVSFLWFIVMPLFANGWMEYSWCVISDNIPPVDCSNQFLTFTLGSKSFNQNAYYELLEELMKCWFSGVTSLFRILVFSFIAIEVFRVILNEVIAIEKEHIGRLVDREVETCSVLMKELNDNNEIVIKDLFTLLRKCVEVEVMFSSASNHFDNADELLEFIECWKMSEAEIQTMEYNWLEKRHQRMLSQATHPNMLLRVDRETGKLDGTFDIYSHLMYDQLIVATMIVKLLNLEKNSKLPILSCLSYYCDRINESLEHQKKSVDLPNLDQMSRHANILNIYCQGLLTISKNLQKYRNDVIESLDNFVAEMRKFQSTSSDTLNNHGDSHQEMESDILEEQQEEENKNDMDVGEMDNFDRMLLAHWEYEIKRKEEEEKEKKEAMDTSNLETNKGCINQEKNNSDQNDQVVLESEAIKEVEAKEEVAEAEDVNLEDSVFRDVDSASEKSISDIEDDEEDLRQLLLELGNENQDDLEGHRDQEVDEQESVNNHVPESNGEAEERLEEQGIPPLENREAVRVNEFVPLFPNIGAEIENAVQPQLPPPAALDGAVPVIAPQPPALAGLQRFEQEKRFIYLAYSKWVLYMGYIIAFSAIFLVFPALVGTFVANHTTHMKQLMDTAHIVIKEVLLQDGNFALVAKILDYSDELSVGLDQERDIVSMIYVAKLKTIFEILLGYSVMISSTLSCYLLYSTKYLTSFKWNFSVQNAVADTIKFVVDAFNTVIKSLFVFVLYLLVLPLGMGFISYKSILPNLSKSMRESLDQSEAAMVVFALLLYLIPILVMVHSIFVAIELRKLLKPSYLRDFLPKDNDIEANGDAMNAAQLNRIHTKILNKSIGELFITFVLRTCIVLVGVLVTIVIPFRLGHIFSLTFTPLTFRFKSTMNEMQIPVEMIISHILLPVLVDKLKYSANVRIFLKYFVTNMCSYLHLESVLLDERVEVVIPPPPGPPPAQPLAMMPAVENDELQPVDGNVQQEVQDDSNPIMEDLPTQPTATNVNDLQTIEANSLRSYLSHDTKFALLIIFMLLGFAFISSWVIHIPIWIGRGLLDLMKMPSNNDFFNYPAGLVVSWGLGYVGQFFIKDIVSTNNILGIFNIAWKWMKLIVLITVAGIMWLAWPPLLIGYALECLAILPFKTSLYTSPQFPFLQSWALGLILLKLFVRCVLTGVFGEVDLRNQLEMLMIRGFQQFEFQHFVQKIYLPIVIPLMDLVCIPFFISRCCGMFTESYLIRTLLARYSMHGYIAARCAWSLLCTLAQYLVNLHNEIRDTRYLLGTELTNRG